MSVEGRQLFCGRSSRFSTEIPTGECYRNQLKTQTGLESPAYLIERSVIEPNQTPIVRLGYAVFALERFTEVLEFTYLGKYFACVNAN